MDEQADKLAAALGVIMGDCDYRVSPCQACNPNEMVAAVISRETLSVCDEALASYREAKRIGS